QPSRAAAAPAVVEGKHVETAGGERLEDVWTPRNADAVAVRPQEGRRASRRPRLARAYQAWRRAPSAVVIHRSSTPGGGRVTYASPLGRFVSTMLAKRGELTDREVLCGFLARAHAAERQGRLGSTIVA